MLKPYLSILFLFILKVGVSQPVLQWAKAFTGVNSFGVDELSNGRSIAVDKQGNVYSAGFLANNVDMDPGPGVQIMDAAGPFDRGIYISKLSPTGEFIWAKQIPAIIEFGTIELALDKDDNVLMASYFTQTVDMDPGPGVHMLTASGAREAFVIKLDPDGNLVWVRQFGGTHPYNSSTEGTALTTDLEGNVVLCGLFYATADFDPGPGTLYLNSNDHYVTFIVKLTSNGDLVWAKSFGDFRAAFGSNSISDVRTDRQGNIYTTGIFGGECDFDPGTGNYYMLSGGFADGFISKLNADGNFVWAKHVGNPVNTNNYYVMPHGMELDSDNNVYTSGTFIGPQDFDPGSAEYYVNSNASTMDLYILKLSEQGEFVWVKTIGGTDHETGADLAIDNANNVYFSGIFNGTVDFDPGPGVSTIAGLYDEFAFGKLSSDGNFIYKAAFRRAGDYGTSAGRRMVTDLAQNIYITGHFSGSTDFDPGLGIFKLASGSPWSPFVVKLGRCKNITASTLTINACASYTLNSQVYEKSGIYTQTIPNKAGCDSIITLKLTLNTKLTEQSKTICEGEFFFAGGDNQFMPGTYKDSLHSSMGCDSIVTTYLTVNPKPSPSLGPDKDLCRNTTLEISPGVFTAYAWHDMSTAEKFTINAPGLYWVNVTNENGCSAKDSIRINAFIDPPTNFLKPVDSICEDQQLAITSSTVFSDYRWSTGATQNVITVEAPGEYWLSATASNGCIGKDTIVVLPKQNCGTVVFIPTAFTPNRDGKNDSFKATIYGNVQSFKLQVFDRAGQLVFQTTNPTKAWNGFHNSILQPATTFVWQCYYQFENGKPEYQKGTVTLIR